jgi:hypothetical protein
MRARIVRSMLCVGLWLAVALSPGVAQPGSQADPGVLPPVSSPHGHTYGEWSARWWKWFLELPADSNHPANGGDCSTGQLGQVWFLIGLPGPTTIHCTVPTGKMLFLPIINTECSNLEGPPFFGATEAERRLCAEGIMDGAADLSAKIDGVPIRKPSRYRVSSPNFHFTVPPNNVLGVPAGSGEAVGDGYYLMLAPLSAGSHIIEIKGSLPAFDFAIDTTIVLTVRR